jgi:folylpolyglutamate synthase/dihydropteroate synthase
MIVLDIREIGPYLLTIGGSNGMNSSSAMIESDLQKHKVNTN